MRLHMLCVGLHRAHGLAASHGITTTIWFAGRPVIARNHGIAAGHTPWDRRKRLESSQAIGIAAGHTPLDRRSRTAEDHPKPRHLSGTWTAQDRQPVPIGTVWGRTLAGVKLESGRAVLRQNRRNKALRHRSRVKIAYRAETDQATVRPKPSRLRAVLERTRGPDPPAHVFSFCAASARVRTRAATHRRPSRAELAN